MSKDTFWKGFWIFFGAALLVCLASGTTAFFLESQSTGMALVAAAYNSNRDPFEEPLRSASSSSPTFSLGGTLYSDALPLGYSNWVWNAQSDWRSTGEVHSGTYALKMTFLKEMSSVGMNGDSFSVALYQSLSVAVYPDASVGDLYLELYDAQGNALSLQSLGWYASSSALVPDEWQVVTIPLANLMGTSTKETVSGFAITGQKPGVAYTDDMVLRKTPVSHMPWVMPPEVAWAPYDPLATSSVSSLPYKLAFTQEGIANWYSYYGVFALSNGTVTFGPDPGKQSDSVSIYRGGKNWDDYIATANLNWGLTSSFSLLARFIDQSNYADCAFSHYADTVQIYEVKGGQSTLMAQTPTLATPDVAPWENVTVSAQVQGPEIDCLVGGTKVLSANLKDMPREGTVGFEAWDQNSYASPHSIKSFTVEPVIHD